MTEYNASNTKQIRAATKEAKTHDIERKQVIYNLMSYPAGRSWVHEFLTRCHCFHSPFTGIASQTDFNCGEQNIGLQLLTEIMLAAPDQYIQMMREANDKEQSNGRRTDDNDSRSSGDFSGLGWNDNGRAVINDYNPGDDDSDQDD